MFSEYFDALQASAKRKPLKARWPPGKRFGMYRQDSDTLQHQLVGEDHLLEVISAGAPLYRVLNRLCTALDVQVGNVVSLVLLSNDEEHGTHVIAQSAARFGLFVFCRKAIFSDSGELLGTLDVYCCFPRASTSVESKLIERVVRLAALAIQLHNHEQSSGSFPFEWKGAAESNPHGIAGQKHYLGVWSYD
jgi:hypothetical protein